MSYCPITKDGWTDKPECNTMSVVWAITEGCNYKCSYCFCRKTFRKFSSIDDLLRGAKTILELGKNAYKFTIYGGEPTYHPGVLDLIKFLACAKDDVYTVVTSNGSRDGQIYTQICKTLRPSDTLVFSVHLAECEPNKFLKNVIIASSLNANVSINFMLTPGHTEKARYLGYKLLEIRELLPLNINILTVFNAEGKFGMGLSEADLKLKKELEYECHNRKATAPYMTKETDPIKCSYPKTIYPKAFNSAFLNAGLPVEVQGWQCFQGSTVLEVFENGDIYGSLCAAQTYMGNIFIDNAKDLLNRRKMICCTEKTCSCIENVPLPKFQTPAAAQTFLEFLAST